MTMKETILDEVARQIHVVMPFAREHLKDTLLKVYENKDIILHPITDKTIEWDRPWVKPVFVSGEITKNPYHKLNYFIATQEIVDEDYYWWMSDDDSVEENVIPKLKGMDDDVVFISMKRGNHVPKTPDPVSMHPAWTLYAHPGKVAINDIGAEQMIVKGKVFKTLKYDMESPYADGMMAIYLKQNYPIRYEPDLFVLFNYFQPGRWNKEEMEEIKQYILNVGSGNLLTFGAREGGIYLQQSADEIAPCLVELLKSKSDIKAYLEIGSAAGGTAFIFNHFFDLEKTVMIDDNKLWQSSHRKEVLKDVNYQEIIGRSDDEIVVDTVKSLKILFDIILVDADHSYKGVKSDVTLYLPFLRPGGFLLLHDTVFAPDGDGRVMLELRMDKGVKFIKEYVARDGSPKFGIALFQKVSL